MKHTFQLIVIFTISLFLLGCPDETNSNQPTQKKQTPISLAELSKLQRDISQLISNKSCNSSSDCKLVALGARACGGPETYEVYSKLHTNEKKLSELASQLEELQKAYNEKNQVASICMMEPKPSFSCSQNICKKSSASNLVL